MANQHPERFYELGLQAPVLAVTAAELTACQKCCQPGGDCSTAYKGTPGKCCGNSGSGQAFCCPGALGGAKCYDCGGNGYRCFTGIAARNICGNSQWVPRRPCELSVPLSC